MTIVRREHRVQFTIVPNAILLDDRLSIEAKVVLGYLLSRPRSWQVRLGHVGRTLRIGRKKLQRIFREIDYVVRDVPLTPTRPADNVVWSAGRKGTCGAAGPKGPRTTCGCGAFAPGCCVGW
jgi:hypothetical protein